MAEGGDFTMDRRLGALVLKAATKLADPFRVDLAEVADEILGELCELFGVRRARVWLQDPAARRLVPAVVHYRGEAPPRDLPIVFAAETARNLSQAVTDHGGLVPLGPDGPVPELRVDLDDGVRMPGLCVPVKPGGDQGGLVTLCGVTRPPTDDAERGAVVAICRLLVGAEASNELLRRLSALWDTGHVGLVIRDPQRRLLQANGAYCEMLGVSLDELVGRGTNRFMHEADRDHADELVDELLSGQADHVENEYRIARCGEERWLRSHVSRVARSDGALGYTFSVVEDVTERRRAERQLRESEHRHRSVVENAPALVVRVDSAGIIVFASHHSLDVVGLADDQLIGAGVEALGVTDPPGRWSAAVAECVAAVEIVELETLVRVGEGWRWIWARLAPELAVNGEPTGVTLYAIDVTRRKTVELQLERAVRRDSLTGLLNRPAFADRLAAQLTAPDGAASGALLFVDLDRFKHINDSMGHLVGDEVLSRVARRLRDVIPEPGLVARVGGDEFLVFVEPVGGTGAVRTEAERIRVMLEAPMKIGDIEVLTSVSIGVAEVKPGIGAGELVQAADLAMYAAKEAGRNRVVVHDDALETRLGLRATLETELRGAVGRDELVVVYQPEVDLATGRLVGVEALVRWDHPERGRLGAADFVDIAEDSGLLVDIGEYALRRTWRDLAAWTDLPPDFQCRVNLSAVQLASPDDLLHLLDEFVGAAPTLQLLCIELTETALLAEPDTARVVLESIRARGGSVAIDDFGTGYGGFTYVKSFPVDLLKIDRSFVADVVDDPYDRAIVEAIIGLATSLGMEVSAEGIESTAQAEALVAMGCRRGQGFLFGSAVSAAEIQRLLRDELDRGPEPAER